MEQEVKKLLKDYFDSSVKETRYSYEFLSNLFQEELNKISFTELEFKNYKDCYRRLGQIFCNNGVVLNACYTILNYKSSKDSSLNGRWMYEVKGNYNYKNAYNQEECYVVCENRIYKLKYRKLDLSKLKELEKLENEN